MDLSYDLRRRKRSKRIGLLTENEREYLKGNIKFDSKRRWSLLKSLVPRIEECTNDLNLIWNKRKVDEVFDGWVQKNWNTLYTLSESIDIRKKFEFKPIFSGRIKFESLKDNNMRKAARLYWLDENEETRINYKTLFTPEHWLTGLKPPSLKKIFREAFNLEIKSKQQIIPRQKGDALTIFKIKKKISDMKRRG